jgi:hypothetical protein
MRGRNLTHVLGHEEGGANVFLEDEDEDLDEGEADYEEYPG